VIERPPSAELRRTRKTRTACRPTTCSIASWSSTSSRTDSAEAIIAEGIASEHVERAVRLVDLNEYKRRQAPVGVRITRRGFGRDRRYPITSAWRMGD
jgi:NAD+ synthase (glutamine-hydrolysing)